MRSCGELKNVNQIYIYIYIYIYINVFPRALESLA